MFTLTSKVETLKLEGIVDLLVLKYTNSTLQPNFIELQNPTKIPRQFRNVLSAQRTRARQNSTLAMCKVAKEQPKSENPLGCFVYFYHFRGIFILGASLKGCRTLEVGEIPKLSLVHQMRTFHSVEQKNYSKTFLLTMSA